jgi:hypothetical protein
MIIPTGSGAMQRSLPERNISHEPPSYIINVVCVIKLTQGKIAGIGWANVRWVEGRNRKRSGRETQWGGKTRHVCAGWGGGRFGQ